MVVVTLLMIMVRMFTLTVGMVIILVSAIISMQRNHIVWFALVMCLVRTLTIVVSLLVVLLGVYVHYDVELGTNYGWHTYD